MKDPFPVESWLLWIGSLIILFWCALIISSCTFHIPDHVEVHCDNCGPPPVVPPPGPTPVGDLTYKNVSNVLSGYCVRCHSGVGGSGGVSLTSYTEVMAYVKAGDTSSKLCTVLQTQKMPPGNPLSKALTDSICLWIKQGAKES